MLKTILIIIISVSILGILIFSIVRRAMKNKIEELVKNEKRKKNYNFFQIPSILFCLMKVYLLIDHKKNHF